MEAAGNLRIMLGKKLRRLREERGLSQQRLAGMAGMVQPMIKRFETGERKITQDHAMKLAPPLRIVPAELLSPGINVLAGQAAVHTVQGAAVQNMSLHELIEDRAHKDGAYAIAFALLKLADVLGRVTDRSAATVSE
jgi:transcriptional regulator with XRE-family HTH domain